jgi:hypothetical protein
MAYHKKIENLRNIVGLMVDFHEGSVIIRLWTRGIQTGDETMTNYGRGRENPGKIHIIDPATYNKTIVGGLALCCNSSCVRMVKAEKSGALAIVDCQRCLKIHEVKNRKGK